MASCTFQAFTAVSYSNVVLSGKWWIGGNTDDDNVPLVIFIHQYAVMGGCGQLMEGIARKITALGYDAITFDLRGAGQSTGSCTYTNRNELQDVLAIIRHVEATSKKSIFLVGSSGGAPLAGSALDSSERIIGGMFIGYTWGFWTSIVFGWAYSSIQHSHKPKLFIVGTADEFTSMDQYRSRISSLCGDVNEMRVIEGKNHFEIEAPVYDRSMAEFIDEFIRRLANNCRDIN